ncbi:OmpA family protein [Aliiroseovarius sp. KMU-50]|uniref:OmpA family protein n=1 Tax=Aliiroseovarius salicola TaxID=3009082 RepID=A0ABT4VWL5_9RHOB|nr:OmpA family protein [Aliiroseovarius sp. KMU-50]MDA5092637.1 OmpA family protein [Aliiroseovarius sp. KMU-50]
MIRLWSAFLVCSLASPTLALELPSGAVKNAEIRVAPAEFARNRFDGSEVPQISLPGEMQVEAWQINGDGQTNYQLMQAMLDQLTDDGFRVVFQCQTVSCGGYDFRFWVGKFTAPDLFIDLGSYQYATVQKGDEFVGLLVSHGGADGFVQVSRTVTTAETTPASISTTPASSVTSTGLAGALLSTGHVVLSDVSFETGSARLGTGSDTQLAELADFLNSSPNARLALVGHTDSEGSLDGNIALSKKRAISVRTQLVEAFGVPANQLLAEGVGFLSPLSSNRTPEGRESNRRVEAVLLSTE